MAGEADIATPRKRAGRTAKPSDDGRCEFVATRVTCPFLGAAVMDGALPLEGPPDAPLARIATVRSLGNSGGGWMGLVLSFFATADQRLQPGGTGWVPEGMFCLDLPASVGAHYGHSGILEGDPATVASGRFDAAEFARLAALAEDGVITRSSLARFVAENLVRDPKATAVGWRAAGALVQRGPPVLGQALWFPARWVLRRRPAADPFLTALGRAMVQQNLFAACGEYGLLIAFLEGSPRTRWVGGEPAISVEDLEALFVRRTLPEGWETWRKRASTTLIQSLLIVLAVLGQYGAVRRKAAA